LDLISSEMRKYPFPAICLAGMVLAMVSCSPSGDPAAGKDEVLEAKVDSVMALMTLEEKIGQLNMPGAGDITTGLANNSGIVPKIREGKVGALLNIRGIDRMHEAQRVAVEESRLGIPLFFAMDVIHGYKTLFPIPLGLAASWDMELIGKTARMAAREASAEGICVTFSPMVDICRDPRWGRMAEGAGEDPFLGSEVARAMVEGYQGEDLSLEHTLMGCVKHFALYGAPEAGRDYNTVDMGRLRMYNDFFPPYKAAVEAGVGSVMAAFNDVDDVPATGSKWLMTHVLRDQWGFEGFVVSDYTGVNEMIEHGVGADLAEVSAQALDAGLDMDLVGEGFLETLAGLVEAGIIGEAQVDAACRRVLRAKFLLGLFDDPYRYGDEDRAASEVFSEENRAFARKTAAESMVLLKNDGGLLPIEKNGTIAVIGPMGNNRENMAGTWSVAGDFSKCASLVDGLEDAVGSNARVLYARGSNVFRDPELEARVSIFGKPTYRDPRPEHVLRQEALAVAARSDVIVAALGESAEMSGECSSRTDIGIPDVQLELLKALVATGKPVVLVLFTGRALAIPWAAEHVPSIFNVWFGGTEAGHAMADVLFGEVNPSGKLPVTFPRNLGQIPIYYSTRSTGRPLDQPWFTKFLSNYLDVPNTPLFPFGHGLSYSRFEYGEISLDNDSPAGETSVTASVQVTNTSDRDGHEVVQLYLHDVVASTTRPDNELKGFQKVWVPAGETVEVSFTITPDLLKFYMYDPSSGYEKIIHRWESGDFEVMIGTSSAELKKTQLHWAE